VTIHQSILPLGAVICAAVGRFPGLSPEEMLAEITRHSRFTAEEFRVLATERLFRASTRLRRMSSGMHFSRSPCRASANPAKEMTPSALARSGPFRRGSYGRL